MLVRKKKTWKITDNIGKYLIQISIHELHNDLIKIKDEGRLSEVWNNNKILVSGTGLRFITSTHVKKCALRYQQLRGYEV